MDVVVFATAVAHGQQNPARASGGALGVAFMVAVFVGAYLGIPTPLYVIGALAASFFAGYFVRTFRFVYCFAVLTAIHVFLYLQVWLLSTQTEALVIATSVTTVLAAAGGAASRRHRGQRTLAAESGS